MRGKKWTEEDLEYLEESWGKMATQRIASNLDRTYSGIVNKARLLNLGDPLTHMDGITISRLSKELGIDYHLIANWIDKYNFPAKKKRLAKERRVLYIGYADFWEWADKNRQMIDFSRFDKYALGVEPEWANEKRIADFNKKRLVPKPHNTPWTVGDINKLIILAKEPDMTYPKMSKILQRTHGAIKRRLGMEGIKLRPSYLPNHNKYTEVENETLETMMHKGHSFIEIAFILDRSEAGVRGKAERMGYTFKNGVPSKGEQKQEAERCISLIRK